MQLLKILTIAGSDPSAGAGIQSDLGVFKQLGGFGFSVITAVTSQNTRSFFKSYELPTSLIKNQLDAILSDFKVDGIKIGMLYGSNTIRTVYHYLKDMNVPIVLDPVLVSSTGGRLLKKDAVADLVRYILPLSNSITPNLVEAKALAGMKKITTQSEYRKAATSICELGPENVIIKGGHSNISKTKVTDYILESKKNSFYQLEQKRITKEGEIHGSGCKLSASLTYFLAKKFSFFDSIRHAREFTFASIKNSKKLGHGLRVSYLPVTDSHVVFYPWQGKDGKDEIKAKLAHGVQQFSNLTNVAQLVPEVGTNFVYSKPNPKNTKDVIGVSGRIVKANKSVFPAGSIRFGASGHVANSLIEITKTFPTIRSAINIRYDKTLLERAKKKAKFLITNYDRKKENQVSRSKEGNTVSWGTKNALSKLKDNRKPPDIIYHKGHWGKEPMILLFGENPFEILKKLKVLTK